MWRKVPWPLCTPAPNGPAELDRARTPDVTKEESKGTKPSSSSLGTNSLTIDMAGAGSCLCSGRVLKSTMHILGLTEVYSTPLIPPKTRKEEEKKREGRKELCSHNFLFKRSQPSSLGIHCAPHAFAYQSLIRQRWLTQLTHTASWTLLISSAFPHPLSPFSKDSHPPSLLSFYGTLYILVTLDVFCFID